MAHLGIGGGDQASHVAAVWGARGDADAWRDGNLPHTVAGKARIVRFDRLGDAKGKHLGLSAACGLEDKDELVPAESGDKARRTHEVLQKGSDGA